MKRGTTASMRPGLIRPGNGDLPYQEASREPASMRPGLIRPGNLDTAREAVKTFTELQ